MTAFAAVNASDSVVSLFDARSQREIIQEELDEMQAMARNLKRRAQWAKDMGLHDTALDYAMQYKVAVRKLLELMELVGVDSNGPKAGERL